MEGWGRGIMSETVTTQTHPHPAPQDVTFPSNGNFVDLIKLRVLTCEILEYLGGLMLSQQSL